MTLINAARITSAHGIKGAVKAQILLDNADWLLNKPLTTSRKGLVLTVERIQPGPRGLMLLTLKGITDRTAAETLQGVMLKMDKADLPEPDEGAVFLAALPDMDVLDVGGIKLTTVVRVVPNPAHPLLELALPKGPLMPLHEQFVTVEKNAVRLTAEGAELLRFLS